MRFGMCLLSLHFYERISWWNQEQMFVDKQFLVLCLLASEKTQKFVISCAAWGELRLIPVPDSGFRRRARLSENSGKIYFFWARNSISRLDEFFSPELVFRFWINHDCNGIFCCWDLSHALKQFSVENPLRLSADAEEEKDKTSSKCLLLSVHCRFEFIFKLIYSEKKLFNWDSSRSETEKDYLRLRQLHSIPLLPSSS